MASPVRAVRLRSLVREELRALPRNSFALAAVAAVFGVLAVPTAFLYSGEAGIEETLVFTWLVLPLVVAILVAARVAAARRTRFVDSLYTTPLRQPTWLAAQAVVGATLALLVLAVQVPFLLVFVAWLGIPALLAKFALAALGVAVFAVALGLFCGVIVGDASPLAAAGLAGGLAFASFVLFMLHIGVVGGPPTSDRDLLLRVTSLSPVALAADLAGASLVGADPVDAWRPAVGIVALTAGLGLAGWIAYTRSQGPLGWERSAGRPVVVALVALAVLLPVATAEVAFEEHPEGDHYVPGESTWVVFVPRGEPITQDSFSYGSVYTFPALPVGKDVELDALVLLLSPPGAAVQGVHIAVEGSDIVTVVAGGRLTSAASEGEARVPAPNDDRPHPVFRVPVTLRAESVTELRHSHSPVEVHTEFSADGRRYESTGRVLLAGEVPGAALQLLGAGLLLPGAALAAFALRKRRTR